MIRVGTAGWTLPRPVQHAFPAAGTHLARYAAVFDAAEINSTFRQSHQPATYRRWAASVPEHFRFSVKMPKAITHVQRLAGDGALLGTFLDEVRALGARLGCLLVQLPPSLAFEPAGEEFLAALRERHAGAVVVEPRHPTWFTDDVDALLVRHRCARVAADPAPVPRAAEPGGWHGLTYWRLHGAPRMYYSSYDDPALAAIASGLRAAPGDDAWCIFDNTASGAAASDALALVAKLRG